MMKWIQSRLNQDRSNQNWRWSSIIIRDFLFIDHNPDTKFCFFYLISRSPFGGKNCSTFVVLIFFLQKNFVGRKNCKKFDVGRVSIISIRRLVVFKGWFFTPSFLCNSTRIPIRIYSTNFVIIYLSWNYIL